MLPPNGALLDDSSLPSGDVMAGLLFLLILCVGVALDVALAVYFIKRPARPAAWGDALKERAFSGQEILVLSAILIALYLTCATVYARLFPAGYDLEPYTLIFQALFFHLPALLVLSAMFDFRRYQAGRAPRAATRWRRAPALLGLSALLYLAAVPILWSYSALYQLVLYRFGFEFHLQDVVEIFMVPAPVLERAAMVFTAVVLAPVFEEVLFRGVLLPWMIRRTGFWPGVALVSTLFSAMHFHLPSFLPLFLFSGMLCVAYARTRSLLVPIGMHACFNGVTIVLLTFTGG